MEIRKNDNDQVKEFQKKFLAHADETRTILVEKHEKELLAVHRKHLTAEMQWEEEKQQLLAVHRKHLTAEMQWEEEKQQLLKIIEGLKALVSRQESDISKMNGSQKEEVTTEILRNELSSFREKTTCLEQSERNQIDEINQLRKAQRESEANFNELVAANQKIKEMEFRMKSLDSAISIRSSESDETLKKLKDDLRSLNLEKRVAEDNAKVFESKCKELQQVNEGLVEELKNARMENNRATMEINTLKATLDNRKPMTEKSGQTFREFVQMQRELVLLREQNEELKKKLKIRQQSTAVHGSRTIGSLMEPTGKGNEVSGPRKGYHSIALPSRNHTNL